MRPTHIVQGIPLWLTITISPVEVFTGSACRYFRCTFSPRVLPQTTKEKNTVPFTRKNERAFSISNLTTAALTPEHSLSAVGTTWAAGGADGGVVCNVTGVAGVQCLFRRVVILPVQGVTCGMSNPKNGSRVGSSCGSCYGI